MQGRLSPISPHGYQVFPIDTWRNEFQLAADVGFSHIEWVLDSHFFEVNPILLNTKDIKNVIQESGVKVVSACFDYLMDKPLTSAQDVFQFKNLCEKVKQIDCNWIVIPYVDKSSIAQNTELRVALLNFYREIATHCRELEIKIALETDLPPNEFHNLLNEIPEDIFFVNYDIGNSASLGFDWKDEFFSYGTRIGLTHIKDRKKDSFSVFLGSGNANIPKVFSDLKNISFTGPYTMQTWRDNLGLPETIQQFAWIKQNCDIEFD